MFPMEIDHRKMLFDFIGGKLLKHGDSYNKGSSLFTKANMLFDEMDQIFILDSKYYKYDLEPKYKQF